MQEAIIRSATVHDAERLLEIYSYYVTDTAINILAYVTTFVLAYMIYRLLLAAVHLVDHLPLAGSLNHGLGAILGLGIERSLTGDILIRDHRAWVFCLASAAELLTDSLTQVRRTAVTAEIASSDLPELAPRFEPIRLNIASERLDAVCAAFAGLSRGQAEKLFSAEKVFVNGRIIADKSTRLKAGDILSVRGFGKAVYDGIEHETRKNRIWIMLRKYL